MLVKKLSVAPFDDPCLIPLGKGLFAKVDKDDFDEINKHRWFPKRSKYHVYASRKGYVTGKEVTLRMHRVIMAAPYDMEVHHVNGNTLDNRKCNLLLLTRNDHIQKHRLGTI